MRREFPRFAHYQGKISLLIEKIIACFPLADILGQTNWKLCCSSSSDSLTAVQYVAYMFSIRCGFNLLHIDGIFTSIYGTLEESRFGNQKVAGSILVESYFFITIISPNYAFDHQKKLWVYSNTAIFFIQRKKVKIFWVTPWSRTGAWVYTLGDKGNFPCILG